MPTKSKLGTVTWIEPEFYISYDSVTGRIQSVGPVIEGYPNFKITVDEAISFTSGKLNANDYRVIRENNQHVVVKQNYDSTISKTYPIKTIVDVFPKLKIIRDTTKNNWIISKIFEEPAFVFVCKKKSSRHYIRTLNIVEKETVIPMIYDSERGDVDLYTQEHHSVIEFYEQ